MISSPSSLPEDILSLVIRASIASLQEDNSSHINTCPSLRLVSSFFNDVILHELFILRQHCDHKLHFYDLDHYSSEGHCERPPPGFLLVWRYFQGTLTNRNIHNTPFFTSVHEAVRALRPLLHDPIRLDTSSQQTSHFGTTARFSSRNPVFNDLPTLLVSAAITRFSVCGVAIRIITNHGRQDHYLDESITQITNLKSGFWVFATACLIGNVDLATRTLPQALENAGSNETWEITDPAFVRCLMIAVQEEHDAIFQFLLDAGVDPNILFRNTLILAVVVRVGRLDLLQMLLRSSHGLHKFKEMDEEVVALAAKLEDVQVRHMMVDALLAHGLYHDETAMRHRVFGLALLSSDLSLAQKMLNEDPEAAVYRQPLGPNVIENLGRGDQSNVELIRLLSRNFHNFAPTPEEDMGALQSEEFSALQLTRHFADFKELLGFLTRPTHVQRFLAACRFEGGIPEVEQCDGILDLTTPTSMADVMPIEWDPTRSRTLGAQALKRAIDSQVMANVEILLDREIQVAEEIHADAKWAATDTTKFQILQKLLSKFRDPRVVITDGEYEQRVLWEPDQNVLS